MKNRTLLLAIVASVAVSAAACAPKPPVVAPTPTVNQDSIDAAARARAAAEAKARADAEAARLKAEADARTRAAAEAKARADAAARAAMDAARAAFATAIYFDFDKYDLKTEARALLDAKLPLMRANPNIRIRIAGHADERGSDEYNIALSQRRAASAKRYLVDQGIPADRIDVVGFGEERPAAMGSNEDAWAKNRRDEFEIIVGGETIKLP
jgi:peptidoglycan-associated lipoprotein